MIDFDTILKKVIAVLKFYANEENYETIYDPSREIDENGEVCSWYIGDPVVVQDKGYSAQKLLKYLKEIFKKCLFIFFIYRYYETY